MLMESLANPVVSCHLVRFVQMLQEGLHFPVADISLPPPALLLPHGKPLPLESSFKRLRLEEIGTPTLGKS